MSVGQEQCGQVWGFVPVAWGPSLCSGRHRKCRVILRSFGLLRTTPSLCRPERPEGVKDLRLRALSHPYLLPFGSVIKH
jgi:hypothetical protein